MKKLMLAALIGLVGLLAVPTRAKAANVLYVVAFNPDPTIGVVFAPDLATAEMEVEMLAQLDPVCWVAPGVCEARASNTEYFIIFDDGTFQII